MDYSDVDFSPEEILNSQKYQKMSYKEKNEFLLKQIMNSNRMLDELLEDTEVLEYQLPELSNKSRESHSISNKMDIDYSGIESVKLEKLTCYLPAKDDPFYEKKIYLIKCYLRSVIDSYDSLLYEERKKNSTDMIDYLISCREEIEEKFLFILHYGEKKVEAKKQDEIKLIYLQNGDHNLFLDDIIGESIEKYDSYLLLLNSIIDQTFKGFKRLNNVFSNLYEVRNDQQRVLFDYVDSSTIIVLQAFTKKVWTDKKYRLNIENRIKKYFPYKEDIKAILRGPIGEKVISEGSIQTEEILELLRSKNKMLVKRV